MWPSEVPVSRTYGLSQRAKKRRVVPQNPLGCLSDWKQRKEFGGEGGIRRLSAPSLSMWSRRGLSGASSCRHVIDGEAVLHRRQSVVDDRGQLPLQTAHRR
jgi:hypothetical protein